jgi:hypothetical protein
MEESQDGLELITLNKAMRLHKDQFEAKGTLPHAFSIRVFCPLLRFQSSNIRWLQPL